MLAFPLLVALGMIAPQAKAQALYLDFAENGANTTAGWTPVYQAGALAGITGVGGTGYNFQFINIGAYGNSATQTLTGSGFHNANNYATAKTFTLSGLTEGTQVKLYACAAWDGNGAGGFIVYGDTGATGVKAQTVGNPGTTGTLANMTLIGTATADVSGVVTGDLWGRNSATAVGNAEGQVGGFVFAFPQTVTATAGANGSISPSGVSNVFSGDSSPAYTITADSGYHIQDVLVNGVSVGPVSSYTLTNIQQNSTIEASFAVDTTAYTITASAGANGSITPSGSVNVFEGVSQAFTITPDTGYHIADVLVDSIPVGAVTSYNFPNVTANHTIAASFAINTFTVSATAGSNGSISPDGDTILNYGDDSPEFTFTPDPGYYVASVLVDGVCVAAVPGVVPDTYTIPNVTANHSIAVTFENRDLIFLDFAGTGNNTSSDWVPIYAQQTTDTMVNVPDFDGLGHDFTFDHVATWNNGALAPLLQSGFYNITGAAVPHPFTLTGLVPGQEVSLYASSAWDGNGAGAYIVYGDSGAAGVKAQNIGTINNYPTLANLTLIGTAAVDATGKVTGSMYGSNGVVGSNANGQVGGFVFAVDEPPVWTITATAYPNGSISPSGDVSVNSGEDQLFTITPDSGYHVVDVILDEGTENEVSLGPVTEYTFDTVVADHTITASFAIDSATWTITASAGANGSISPSGDVVVNNGVNKIFTITPDTGYHIDSVLVDGNPVAATSPYTFVNVTEDHTIVANFAINTYTIDASVVGANGSISPVGTTVVNYGDDLEITMTPDSGYHVDNVFVDGVLGDPVSTYTFTNVTANHTITASFDNHTKLKLDFTQYGGSYTTNWTPVYGNLLNDTPLATVTDVNGLGYDFSIAHVGCYDNANPTQSLTRSGFYNSGGLANDHTFTLTGLNVGQTVALYACAAWDGNGQGGYVVFGDSGASGVKAQTVGDPGVSPTLANLTLIGTATADAGGNVTGTLNGAGGVGVDNQGQLGGMMFVITPGGTPPVVTPFSEWADSWGLEGTDALEDADPDFDGVSNIVEFALSGDPTDGSSNGHLYARMATVDSVPNVLTLTIAVLDDEPTVFTADGNRQTATAGGVTYTVEGSDNLGVWGGPVVTEVTDGSEFDIQSEFDTPDTGWVYKTFRTDGSTATDATDFIRVGVK